MSDCKEITAAELREACERAGLHVSLAGSVDAATCAMILDKSERTLRLWREREYGPAYHTLGRVSYALADIAAFINESCRQEAAESGNHRQRGARAP
jgi:hypothetical protein